MAQLNVKMKIYWYFNPILWIISKLLSIKVVKLTVGSKKEYYCIGDYIELKDSEEILNEKPL